MAKTKNTPVGHAPDPTKPPVVRKVKHDTKHDRKDYPYADRWWLQPENTIFQHVNGILTTIDNRQVARRFANVRWLKLYSNFDAIGLTGGVFSRMMPAGSYASRSYRFTLNVVESCVDTATARIAKTRPLPEILTSAGTFKQTKKAKLLTKYLKGMIDELDMYQLGQTAFRDCCVFGTGAVKLFIEDGKIKAKRIIIDDIAVDEEDGRDGDPRQLHHRGHVNRDILCELFPQHEDKIRHASSVLPGEKYTPISQDLVAITESWHLPSGPEAKDGLHVICTDNCTLFSEEWNRDWYPFAFLRWKPRPLGFYGMGLAEQLGPIQLEINKICIRIQEAIDQVARPNIFVSAQANIIPQHISSIPGAVIKVNGNPQQSVMSMVPEAMSAEVYSWLDYLYTKAYEVTGVSQMSAQSQKPAGLNSGAALRTFEDIESGRFELTAQRYEDFFCQASTIILALSKELFSDGVSNKINVKDHKFLETIDWKNASLEDDEFEMEMFSVSSLPNSPGGRLQTVTELMQAGYFDKTRALELLNFPDIDDAIDLATAGLENAKMVVDKIRWEGVYTVPNSLMNVQACMELAHNAYLEATMQDTPEKNLELLMTFIADCQALILKANPPPPPPPMAPPMARPNLPPRSDMLPVGPNGGPGPLSPGPGALPPR